MSEKTQNSNSFPWVHHYVKFVFLCLVIVGLPILLSVWFLVSNSGGNFGRAVELWRDRPSATVLKLLNWLALVNLFFGFVVSFVFYFSVFSFQVYSSQIGNFFMLPKNRRIFYRMSLPVGFDYDTRILGKFMKDLYHGFIINSMDWSSTLRSGKYHQTIGFDYIVEKGQVSYYLFMPLNKQPLVIEAFKKYFPQITLELVRDPFANLPNQWSESQNFKFEQVAGCVISHKMSEIYGSTTSDFDNGNKRNISDLLLYLGTAFPQNKFVLQYVFTFDSLVDPSYYDQKYEELASGLLNKYSPSNAKKKIDSDAFAALIPKHQVQKINDISARLSLKKGNLVKAGIKIIGFCSNEDYAKTERALDKAIRAYFQENSTFATDNKLEKAYLTATNQTYFNHHKVFMDLDPNARLVFDRFVFLPTILEPYFANLYNQFFYPNENRWRRKNLYLSFRRRLGYKPWSDSFCLLEFDSIDRYFQIPVVRSRSEGNIVIKK
jgi:hypothetical protein